MRTLRPFSQLFVEGPLVTPQKDTESDIGAYLTLLQGNTLLALLNKPSRFDLHSATRSIALSFLGPKKNPARTTTDPCGTPLPIIMRKNGLPTPLLNDTIKNFSIIHNQQLSES